MVAGTGQTLAIQSSSFFIIFTSTCTGFLFIRLPLQPHRLRCIICLLSRLTSVVRQPGTVRQSGLFTYLNRSVFRRRRLLGIIISVIVSITRPKAIILVHFNVACEINESHDIAKLLLLGEVGEFLLVVEGDLVVLVPGDPGVLERGGCVVPL